MSKIIENSMSITDFSIQSTALLVLMIILLIFLIYYLLPFGIIFYKYRVAKKIKIEKRYLLKQIVMQREIEEEIEREIEKEEKGLA